MDILPSSLLRKVVLIFVTILFTTAGITHFTMPDVYMSIMPPYFPAPLALVYISGVFEILGGLGVLIPRLRRVAGLGLILLLITVYPANIYMALNPDQFPDIPQVALWARLPLQLLFGWLVWFAACSTDSKTA